MFGVVWATLNIAPTPSTPRTAAMAALRMKPVPRETIVPTAMVRVARPRPAAPPAVGAADAPAASLDEPVMSGRPVAPQCATADPQPGREQEDTRPDSGH